MICTVFSVSKDMLHKQHTPLFSPPLLLYLLTKNKPVKSVQINIFTSISLKRVLFFFSVDLYSVFLCSKEKCSHDILYVLEDIANCVYCKYWQ